MLYFSFPELTRGVVSAIIFGFFFGILYSAVGVLCNCLENLFRLPKRVRELLLTRRSSFKDIWRFFSLAKCSGWICHFLDFLFTAAYGTLFTVLLYLCSDGIFRFYIFFITVVVAVFVNKSLGKFFKTAFLFIFHGFYFVLLSFLYTILKLLYGLYVKLKAVFAKKANKYP